VIANVPVAFGAAAFAGPVTVAVKVSVAPSGAVAGFPFTSTVGVEVTTVTLGELDVVAKEL
jgi:hypothetical protein